MNEDDGDEAEDDRDGAVLGLAEGLGDELGLVEVGLHGSYSLDATGVCRGSCNADAGCRETGSNASNGRQVLRMR